LVVRSLLSEIRLENESAVGLLACRRFSTAPQTTQDLQFTWATTIYGRNPVAKFPGGYAIATSGSTGRPKTVSISDAKLRAYSSYRIRRHKGLEGSRMSQNFEPVFDAFFESLTWAWGSNSTLVVASREDRLAIDDYVDLQQLTVWNGLPSQVKLASRLSHLSKHKSKTLKLAMFGGERWKAMS